MSLESRRPPSTSQQRTLTKLDLGCYEAPRAAALSGVPISTIYYWARVGLIVPSVSPVREKLWSYGDLLDLRLVDWLRKPKEKDGQTLSPTTMRQIRLMLDACGPELWQSADDGQEIPRIFVSRDGQIVYVDKPDRTIEGQGFFPGFLDLFAPFDSGPDLLRPRPKLRIIPGKVAGEPHLSHSRVTTRSLWALRDYGYDTEQIALLYPDEDVQAIAEALDLEEQLSQAA